MDPHTGYYACVRWEAFDTKWRILTFNELHGFFLHLSRLSDSGLFQTACMPWWEFHMACNMKSVLAIHGLVSFVQRRKIEGSLLPPPHYRLRREICRWSAKLSRPVIICLIGPSLSRHLIVLHNQNLVEPGADISAAASSHWSGFADHHSREEE